MTIEADEFRESDDAEEQDVAQVTPKGYTVTIQAHGLDRADVFTCPDWHEVQQRCRSVEHQLDESHMERHHLCEDADGNLTPEACLFCETRDGRRLTPKPSAPPWRKTWTGEKMNYKEYSFTASEITQLEYMLSIMPKDHEIERIGLEHRLEKARQKLEGVPIPTKPKSIHVNFQGEPVVNGESIDANFAGKATTAFAESTAITTAGAAGQLRDTGAIPHQGLGRQLVSGITGGSFGFEIELPPPTEDERAQGQTGSPAEKAMVMIQDLLETCSDRNGRRTGDTDRSDAPAGGQESDRVPENTEKQRGPR